VTAEAGQIGGFAITDSAITGSGFFLSGSATGNQFFISASNFNVKANGDITASNADISGNINAQTGTIGGFIIDTNLTATSGLLTLEGATGEITGSQVLFTGGKISGSNLEINVENFTALGNSVEISGSNFHLLNGNITASNVDLSGNINAETGTIGGFAITDSAITGSGFLISGSATGNEFFISASNFNVKANGDLTASNADISGRIVAESGTIGGFSIDTNLTNSGGSTLILKGSTGQITASAAQITGDITAQSGTIGGFNIGSNLSNSAGSTLILKGATGQITASAAQIIGDITATSGQIAGFTISGDTIVGDAYTIDASATADGEYFISSSEVLIEGNGDARFGEYSFALINDASGYNGLTRDSSLTDIRIIQGTDANGNGGLMGVGPSGDFYIAPISASILVGGGYDAFARELKYSIANDRWEFDTNVYADDNFEINKILKVNDYARIDALRVGTTNTDPGDGNLYVENNITADGLILQDDSGTGNYLQHSFTGDGVRYFIAPYPSSVSNFGDEFGYHFTNELWYVETPFTIGYANGASTTYTLDVNGTANIEGNLTVAGDIDSTGTISGSSLDSSGNTTIRGNLTVLGDTTISGDVSGHPDITQGSNISVNGSNGTVIQDLTITLDENGHVTTSTAGTVNLDGRYYTETESDNRFVNVSGDSMTGDLVVNGSLLRGGDDTTVDIGTSTVESVSTSTYDAAFFDFVIKKGSNLRAGTMYAVHDGTNVEFTETSTQDLGDTSDVTLSVDIATGNLRLRAESTSDGWTVKALVRGL
jgi:hypothetical protein